MTLKEIKEWAIKILTDKSCSRVYLTLPQIDWEELRRRAIEVLTNKRGKIDIPIEKIEAIAEMILPDIVAFFQSEEGKKVFEEWKKEQEEKQKRGGGET